jgi:hypothetical protein
LVVILVVKVLLKKEVLRYLYNKCCE